MISMKIKLVSLSQGHMMDVFVIITQMILLLLFKVNVGNQRKSVRRSKQRRDSKLKNGKIQSYFIEEEIKILELIIGIIIIHQQKPDIIVLNQEKYINHVVYQIHLIIYYAYQKMKIVLSMIFKLITILLLKMDILLFL